MEVETQERIVLSIVIPVWNRAHEIVRTICSIASQFTEYSAEIIVVDDNGEGTEEQKRTQKSTAQSLGT